VHRELEFLARELRDGHLADDLHFAHDPRALSVGSLADDVGAANEFPRFGQPRNYALAPAAAGRLKRKKPAYRWLSFLFRFLEFHPSCFSQLADGI
jgi:hypothetical protein